ncbi:MAG: HNH endonuclease [Phycisphaerae bacterium]
MKEIFLTQGLITSVDDYNYEWLNQWKWCANRKKDCYYAYRAENKKEYEADGRTCKQRKYFYMHRMILERILGRKLESWEETDHRNNNSLDNQENNLRVGTHQQNLYNRNSFKGASSLYIGVSWNKSLEKWEAHIKVNGKKKHLGFYSSEIEAAKIRDEAAKFYYGEFVKLNF